MCLKFVLNWSRSMGNSPTDSIRAPSYDSASVGPSPTMPSAFASSPTIRPRLRPTPPAGHGHERAIGHGPLRAAAGSPCHQRPADMLPA